MSGEAINGVDMREHINTAKWILIGYHPKFEARHFTLPGSGQDHRERSQRRLERLLSAPD